MKVKGLRLWYTGIRVRNLRESLEFYTKVLGMEVVRRGKMGHGGKYVGLCFPGSDVELELNYYPAGTRFAAKYEKGEELDHLGFAVKNPLEAFNQLVARGARVALGPDSKGTELYVMDPDGVWLELCRA